MLEQVVERGRRDVGLDRHVRARLVGDALDDPAVDRHRLHVDHPAEPAVQRAQLRLAGRDRRDAHALGRRGALRQDLAAPLLGLRRLAPVGGQPPLERAQVLLGGEPPALDHRERLAVLVGDVELGLRDLGREDLHDRGGARLDERLAVAVDDVAARRLDLDLAHAVVARLADVVVAGQDLEEPEPEEDDREGDEGHAAEHGDAHRELRRDRRPAVLDGRRHRARPGSAGSGRRSCTRGGAGAAGRRAGTGRAPGGTRGRPASRAAC